MLRAPALVAPPLLLLAPCVALLAGCPAPDEAPADSTADVPVCGAEIMVPQSGFDASTPVPADPDAATFGAAPAPFQVHLSWMDEPSTTMAVVWRTDGDTLASRVEYGLDTTYGSVSAGASFFLLNGEEFGRIHEVHLCDLTPGTEYHYRVGGEGHWSEDRTFRTAPARGSTEAIRFLVAGDSRDNQAVWGQILQLAEKHAPDFYMFTGDAVDLGTNLTEWDAWYGYGEGYFDRRPVLQAHGNHEFQLQAYYALVALPGNEQWYSFDYGPAHFAVLNDTVAVSGDREVQADWLRDDLAATALPWKLAFHHIPAYSSCTAHGGDPDLAELWSPVEEEGGVAVDFAGHNHNYERSYSIRAGERVADGEGTTYVVSAGAGADLYGNEGEDPRTAVYATTENYTMVEVTGTTLTITAYDLAGNVLDTYQLTRP